MNKSIYMVSLFLALMLIPSAGAKLVTYDGVERDEYHIRLLTHVLSYFPEKEYLIQAQGIRLPKKRSLHLLATNDGVDVMVGTATKAREAEFQAIYFPILKGLNGWRIPIIQQGKADLFSKINTLAELKKLKIGLFHTWTDVEIFEYNGFEVAKGTTHKGMFKMLDKGRFDYLPQSIIQAKPDVYAHDELKLAIDNYVLIKYPSAYYYYVNKGNDELAKDIKTGLELALADGSFERLFQAAFGQVLEKYSIEKRTVFTLLNPLLVDENLIGREDFWAQIDDF